jgi:methylmalonyl-CoA/ethylmalonyl-CoA epimerase
MSDLPLKFHHFGLAVRRPDEARTFLTTLGYRLEAPVLETAQKVHLQLAFHATHPTVETIWPGETEGPVGKLIQRNPPGIIYHVCYETEDLPAALARLEAAGLQPLCISQPTVTQLFQGRKVSFYNVLGLGLVEMLE